MDMMSARCLVDSGFVDRFLVSSVPSVSFRACVVFPLKVVVEENIVNVDFVSFVIKHMSKQTKPG